MTLTVRAGGYGGPDQLRFDDLDLPDPGPGEVRIEVRAAGVNPADVKSYSGVWGTDPTALPKPLGFEVAGVVTGVGPGADGPEGPLAVGDEVIAYRITGGYAAEVVVPARSVVGKPITLDWAEASGLLLTGATAVHALTAASVGEGDTVLIHGAAGGVGLNAVQLGVLRGARVIATASPRNHDLLRELGAEPVSYGDGLLERVRRSAPDGVDAALDLVGTDEALDVSLALVADRDRIATIANFDRGPDEGIKLLGAGGDPGDQLRAEARTELTALAAAGKLRVRVGHTFALTEAAAAHELVASGRADGKIALIP